MGSGLLNMPCKPVGACGDDAPDAPVVADAGDAAASAKIPFKRYMSII